ncbi:aminotransferase class V-fold PLP-dependent enzyme [Rhodobacteraceae bacterium 2CG4]|uniref:Aminotransferase class V-fold PLP-dependent enzyme n=1 Tax=Halovulum marinum TaxID=2662447 RepID=A0A6L5YYE4_9RHOB|nr:aminotransferase class V-fold PLP-dependent enzyme [Halovulum marinum]MSU89228.1 aminotransferase class V-fold PLP-dependent enzyme [Halovulum marinum]
MRQHADGAGLRGCPTIINAAGPLTRLAGAPLAEGVLEAMTAAEAASFDMFELQAHASRAIAGATGAEAGVVTCGAAAGLLLATAACLARLDIGRMDALPDTDGPDQVIVARGQRNGYDHACRAAGARLVEVGLAEALAGAGIRDAEPWEYQAAVGPRSAAILYVAGGRARPPLAEVAAVARANDLPLIVDAAAELPPAANLRRFVAEGADLVVFSGGKVLGGPAGTGILCGRRELIASAALQFLDMDMEWSAWHPPADLIDKARLAGLPRQGIGRSCKPGKHEIFGLLAALDRFVAEGDAARHARWLATCRQLAAGLICPHGVETAVEGAEAVDRVPVLVLRCATDAAASELRARLAAGAIPVHTRHDPFRPEVVTVNPICLRPADIPPLIAALSRR